MNDIKIRDDLKGFYEDDYNSEMTIQREYDAKKKAANIQQLLSPPKGDSLM